MTMLFNVSMSQVDTTQYDDFLHDDIFGLQFMKRTILANIVLFTNVDVETNDEHVELNSYT